MHGAKMAGNITVTEVSNFGSYGCMVTDCGQPCPDSKTSLGFAPNDCDGVLNSSVVMQMQILKIVNGLERLGPATTITATAKDIRYSIGAHGMEAAKIVVMLILDHVHERYTATDPTTSLLSFLCL